MDVRVQIHGAAALLTAFSRMPAMVSRNMRIATKQSGDMVREEAQDRHGFTTRTGNLQNAIKSSYFEPMTAVVYMDTQMAPYGPFVHQGTGPHLIKTKNKRALRWATPGGFVFCFGPNANRGRASAWVANRAGGGRAAFQWPWHPGTAPDSFLYAALARKQGDVTARFQLAVDTSIRDAGVTP
jgi:hypothetical protein